MTPRGYRPLPPKYVTWDDVVRSRPSNRRCVRNVLSAMSSCRARARAVLEIAATHANATNAHDNVERKAASTHSPRSIGKSHERRRRSRRVESAPGGVPTDVAQVTVCFGESQRKRTACKCRLATCGSSSDLTAVPRRVGRLVLLILYVAGVD